MMDADPAPLMQFLMDQRQHVYATLPLMSISSMKMLAELVHKANYQIAIILSVCVPKIPKTRMESVYLIAH